MLTIDEVRRAWLSTADESVTKNNDERERESERECVYVYVCMYVCVSVCDEPPLPLPLPLPHLTVPRQIGRCLWNEIVLFSETLLEEYGKGQVGRWVGRWVGR